MSVNFSSVVVSENALVLGSFNLIVFVLRCCRFSCGSLNVVVVFLLWF